MFVNLDSMEEVAAQMLSCRVHRVIVTRDQTPVGIVTALDLVQEFKNSLRMPVG